MYKSDRAVAVGRAVVVLSFLFAPVGSTPGQEKITVEDIIAVGRGGQPKIRTAHIRWKEDILYPKGFLSAAGPTERKRPSRFPDRDTWHSVDASLKLKDDLVRYERVGMAPNVTRGCFSSTKYLLIFGGGKRSYDYYEYDVPDAVDGKLRFGSDLPIITVYTRHDESLLPIKWALRIEDGQKQPTNDHWDLLEPAVVRDGIRYVRLVRKGTPDPYKFVFSFDQSKNNALARMSWFQSGALGAETEIDYQAHPLLKWFPKSWHYVHHYRKMTTGELVLDQETIARVTDVAVNVDFSNSEFEFHFPPRTYVTLTNPPDGGPSRAYVTDSNADKVAVSSLPRSGDLEKIVESVFEPRPWYRSFGWSVPVACAALLVGLVVWRNRRRSVNR